MLDVETFFQDLNEFSSGLQGFYLIEPEVLADQAL